MEKLCSSLYGFKDLCNAAICHGKTYESVAIEKFEEQNNEKVTACGLFIHTQMSFLAASPDGCIYKEGKRILLEVKCPYNGREKEIIPGEYFPFLEMKEDGVFQLKRNHNYYYQIIGQLALARSKMCYFVVYTHQDFYVEKILFDSDFFELHMFPKLQMFYECHYKPFIAKKM